MQSIVTIHVQHFIRFVKTVEALNKLESADTNFITEFSKGLLTQT